MLISPAKKLAAHTDYEGKSSHIRFKKQTAVLVNILRQKTPAEIASLMKLSEKLAYLNYTRYQLFNPKSYTCKNAFPALFHFQGDVYQGLEAETFNKNDLAFCQKSLGILSGLYGLLAPLDLIQPYRLEMGTVLTNPAGKDLIAFWKTAVTIAINETLKANHATHLVNLASNEYFSVVDKTMLTKPIIKIDFKDEHKGKLKTIGIYAKRARGMMVNFVVKNRCKIPADLQDFTGMDYTYNSALSNAFTLTFIR